MKRYSEKSYSQLSSPQPAGPRGLLTRIIAVVAGIGALVLSLLVGAVFIAAGVGFMLIIGLVMAIRVWWVKRKMQRYAQEHGDLQAEYTVVETKERRR